MLRALAPALALALAAAPALANGISVAKHAHPVPDGVSPGVRAALAAGGATAKVGNVAVDFWWAASLAGGGKDWSGVAEGTLVGAMRLDGTFKDIRGRNVKPGVYLLRFALQPQNGDHLGVSPHREFLLATPAASDTDPAPIGHDAAVKLAAETINISHPAVFSIDPPVATGAPLTTLETADGYSSVVFEVPTPQGALKFGLVLIGHIEA